jgi:hypothetical protein
MKNAGRKGEFGRCVEEVSERSGIDDPRAVCAASFSRAYGSHYLAARKAAGKRNPVHAAQDAFERFHGHPATNETVFESVEHEHEVYADVGELVALVIVPEGEKRGLKLTGFDGARLTMSEDWDHPQLFVIGGDQTVDLGAFGISLAHEREILGKVADIEYYTVKDHLSAKDGGEANYTHKFGEETARGNKARFRILVSPTAAYDTLNQVISLWGGKYTIEAEGIRD